MAKVTSKLQVTIPKAIADARFAAAERLRLFDQATARQRAREAERPASPRARDRGWPREELYRRGGAD